MRQLDDFPNLNLIDHPLIRHKLTLMRERARPTNEFRALLREISLLMGYEITRDLPLETKRIETPLTSMNAPVLEGKKLAVVPILRAGLGMADGLLDLVPSARVGHIGLFRNPVTKEPVEYLVKLPDPAGRLFIPVDPMLATGNSAVHACSVLIERGVPAKRIRLMVLVAAPEGVRRFHSVHPDIAVYMAELDDRLDERAYIVPGLGDAGDRLFGTK